MPKELFDQNLIETPDVPEDDDRIALGKPGIAGAINLTWLYFKQLLQTAVNWIDFTPQVSNPTYKEGRLFYQDSEKALAIYNDRANTLKQLGRELGDRGLNNTGSTILNGQVVYISGDNGTNRTIALADASDSAKALGTIGFATEDIANGQIGEITFIGKVRDVDTSGCTVANVLYLSTTPGQFTETPPQSPNYIVFLGNCGRVDASNGEIDAKIIPRNNTQSVIKIFNGSVLEDTSTSVSSDGSDITLSYEQNGGGDLSLFFDSGFYEFDSTPAATVILTAGTDSSPILNYVFIPDSTKLLTANTTGFPTEQHVPVATVLCQSALGAQTDGVYKMHAWTDHLSDAEDQGHLSHVNSWIRNQQATWLSGITPTTSIITNPGAIDNVYFSSSLGDVLQLHEHVFPALDMQTSDPIWIINDFTTKYDRLTDLSSLDTDSDGNSLRTNNTYYSIVVIGVVSEDTADCKYMANAPSGFYTNATDAENDPSGYSNYSIPTDFKGTGFLIARIVLRYQTASSGTLTEVLTEDLRGLLPSTSPGGGGSGTRDEISDTDGNTFVNVGVGDLVDIKSNLSTGNLLTLKRNDDTEVLQIDSDGALYNDSWQYYYRKNNSIFLGCFNSGTSVTSATNNISVGLSAGKSLSTGTFNTAVGMQAGLNLTSGVGNTLIGNASGYQIGGGDNNTMIGRNAGYNSANQDNNIMIGYYAGYYSIDSDIFLLANQQYADAATEKTNSLMYGIHGATPSAQMLRINGTLNVNTAELTNQVAGDIQSGNSLILPEITTPTADTNYGKIYTKTDNKLYFQDGSGVEHEIAFV
jgi:hypothetical protein